MLALRRTLFRPLNPRYPLRLSRKMANMTNPRPLHYEDGPMVWIDCEMTGLDPKKDVLLEIAVIITNGDLKRVDPGISCVIKTEKKVLDEMDEWCVMTHGKTGLTAACLSSDLTHTRVESDVLEYIKRWVPERRTAVLAGNSVHADRSFLVEHMPSITDWLHYRIVDVSSIKELKHRWFPNLKRPQEDYPVGGIAHRALSDIQASITELEWYRENIFIRPTDSQSDTSDHPNHTPSG